MSDTKVKPAARVPLSFFVGEHSQIDVQVPARMKLSIVINDLVDYARDYLPEVGGQDVVGESETGWRLREIAGTYLPNDQTLEELGHDGTRVYELTPAPSGEEFTAKFESVAVLVMRVGIALFKTAKPREISTALMFYATALLSVAGLLMVVAAFKNPGWVYTGALAGAVGVLTAVAARDSRGLRDGTVTDLCAVTLLVFAPVTASLVLLQLLPGRWGGPNLLVAGFVAVLVSAYALSARRHLVVWSAIAVVAVFVVASQLVSVTSVIPSDRWLCMLVWVLVLVILNAEGLANRLARVPVPDFPSGSGKFLYGPTADANNSPDDPVDDGGEASTVHAVGGAPDPEVVLEQGRLANIFLTGLIGGLVVTGTVLVALIVARHPHSVPWLLYGAGIALVFGYRCWHYAAKVHLLTWLGGVFAPAVVFVVIAAREYGLLYGAGLALTVAVLGILAPGLIPTTDKTQSPIWRMARQLSEFVVLALVLGAPIYLVQLWSIGMNRTLDW